MALRTLITGAAGFIGQRLSEQAACQGFSVRGALRKYGRMPCGVESVVVGEINGTTDWNCALDNIDVVIHLAARVHIMRESVENPLEEFRKVNVAGTQHLARSAATSGVKRFIYVSSIGVNGIRTALGRPYTETDSTNPHNAYTLSKWEAEQSLSRISEETGLEVIIVRPPLVYGVGAPGNFAQMLKVLRTGIPLPLASVHNLRSFVYIENLVDALIACAAHPVAAGQTYLVSDGDDISTPDLLRRLGTAMGRPARLFPCPLALLRMAGWMTGKADQVERLLGSLQVDSGKIRRELNWTPPYTLEQGLRATADGYRAAHP